MARLYSNKNFPLPCVTELRRLGHDVLTIRETGKAGQAFPDPEVLQAAVAEERIVLTLNRRHFVRLHQISSNHFGIIVCTIDPNFAALAKRIDECLNAEPEMRGRLIRVNRPSSPPNQLTS